MDDQLKHDLETVGKMRVYFGHQSVGRNILQGLKEIAAEARSSAITFVSLEEATTLSGPFFAESTIGENGNPDSKCDAFRNVIDREQFGDSLDIAFAKFCYVDIHAGTNVEEMFAYYRQTISTLQREHPNVRIMHTTVPLTTSSAGWKRMIKKIIGRSDVSDIEAYKRSAFNEMILQEYGKTLVFDLAAIESRKSDGTKSSFDFEGKTVYTLLPEYTDDGGHLNQKGQRVVARELLRTLAMAGAGRHNSVK